MADEGEHPDVSTAESTTAHNDAAQNSKSCTKTVRDCDKSYPMAGVHNGLSPFLQNLIGIKDAFGGGMGNFFKMLEAEYWGTFFLVFLGVSSCCAWPGGPAQGIVSIALVFGLAVATMAQTIGHVSGCHINPAVSLGLVASGDCGIIKAFCYIIVQIIGAFMGGLCAGGVLRPDMKEKLGISTGLSKINGQGFFNGVLTEALITFALVFLVCAVCDKLRQDIKGSAPLAIGLSITLGHLAAIPATGASMNPARTLGPFIAACLMKPKHPNTPIGLTPPNTYASILAAAKGDLPVYIVGPILGGIFAGLIYRLRFKVQPPKMAMAMAKNDTP